MMKIQQCSLLVITFLLSLAFLSLWQLTNFPYLLRIYVTNPQNIQLFEDNTDLLYTADKLPSWDYSTLINHNDFKFNIIKHVCNGTPPFLLILVHTAPGNVAKRTAIRKTWGEPRDDLKVLFMMGSVKNETIQKKLIEEDKIHGDLIQGNFQDAYRNLTYKHIMVFKYAIYYCPQAKYLLKVDDDVFVNIPTLMSFLNYSYSKYGSKKLILCSTVVNYTAERLRTKWIVSRKEYPNRYYPTFCYGWWIVYSPDVVFQLYREAQRSQYFWIDDVHITGILANRLNLVPTPLKNLSLTRNQVNNITKYNSTDNYFFLFGSSNLQQHVIYKLWSIVKKEMKNITLVKVG